MANVSVLDLLTPEQFNSLLSLSIEQMEGLPEKERQERVGKLMKTTIALVEMKGSRGMASKDVKDILRVLLRDEANVSGVLLALTTEGSINFHEGNFYAPAGASGFLKPSNNN